MYHDRSFLNLVYQQSTGRLWLADREAGRALLACGYSGAPGFVNAPSAQAQQGKGPIPVGLWKVGLPRHHPRLGPLAFACLPEAETQVYGRSGFFIHGDNRAGNQSASTGCIIIGRYAREVIASILPDRLQVIP